MTHLRRGARSAADLASLLDNNRRWAAEKLIEDPGFFRRLATQQTPKYLWIGCADSRVPANVVLGLDPGEIFVHCNVANLMLHSDINCLSVLQYAVQTLRVRHIIVCGHYGCGGVQAALESKPTGPIASWLRPIRDLVERHAAELATLSDAAARADRVCELNVAQQVGSVASTGIVLAAWRRRRRLSVHGLCYGVGDGLLRDLGVSVSGGPTARPPRSVPREP